MQSGSSGQEGPASDADDDEETYSDPSDKANDIRIVRDLLRSAGYSKEEVGRLVLDNLTKRHLRFLIYGWPKSEH